MRLGNTALKNEKAFGILHFAPWTLCLLHIQLSDLIEYDYFLTILTTIFLFMFRKTILIYYSVNIIIAQPTIIFCFKVLFIFNILMT